MKDTPGQVEAAASRPPSGPPRFQQHDYSVLLHPAVRAWDPLLVSRISVILQHYKQVVAVDVDARGGLRVEVRDFPDVRLPTFVHELLQIVERRALDAQSMATDNDDLADAAGLLRSAQAVLASSDYLIRDLGPTHPRDGSTSPAENGRIWEMDDPPPPARRDERADLAALLEIARSSVDERGDVLNAAWERQLIEQHAEAESDRIQILGEIALRSEQSEKTRMRLQELVDRARQAGITWSIIGNAARISPQAAHRKWDAEARRKHSEYQRNRLRPQSSDK